MQAYKDLETKAVEMKDLGVTVPDISVLYNKVSIMYGHAMAKKAADRKEPGKVFEEFLNVERWGDESFVHSTRKMESDFLTVYKLNVEQFLQREIDGLMNQTNDERENNLQQLEQTLDDAECITTDTLR